MIKNIEKEQIINLIQEYKEFVITGHINNDGDCIGSLNALGEIIKQINPNSKIKVVDDTSQENLYLNVENTFNDEVEFEKSLGIILDTSTRERIFEPKVLECKQTLLIDHHQKGDEFSDYYYTDQSSPATAQILVYMFEKYLNNVSASELMMGILTDTLNFSIRQINAKTFNAASILTNNFDLNIGKINKNINVKDNTFFEELKYCISNMQFNNHHSFVIFNSKIKRQYIPNLLQQLSYVEDSKVYSLYYPISENKYICEFRSFGDVNVFEIAKSFGGGGHLSSSGATIDKETLNDVIEKINTIKY